VFNLKAPYKCNTSINSLNEFVSNLQVSYNREMIASS